MIRMYHSLFLQRRLCRVSLKPCFFHTGVVRHVTRGVSMSCFGPSLKAVLSNFECAVFHPHSLLLLFGQKVLFAPLPSHGWPWFKPLTGLLVLL
jgi:hypothetical protein